MKKRILWPHGFSLIEIVLALGLLSLLLMLLTSGMSGMQRAGKMTEGGERCRALANVINASIQSQAGTSRIHNVGPTTGNLFDAGAETNIKPSMWESRRHRDSGDNIFSALTTTAANAILNDAPIGNDRLDMRTHLPLGEWQFSNHLNIDNAANQLIAAINQGRVPCVTGLQDRGADLSDLFAPFLAEELQRQGLDVQIFFAADVVVNGGSLCSGGGATVIDSASLPPESLHVDYRVSIMTTAGAGGSEESVQSCSAQGRVAFSPDRDPPLTGIRIIGAGPGGSLCGSNPVTGLGKQGVPSFCTPSGSEPSIELEVVTFKNTGECRSCLHQQYAPVTNPLPAVIRRADAPRGTCSQPVDAVASCLASNQCEFTDPGSTFFCRLGEKHWVAGRSGGAQTQNDWQPCHLAQLRDYDGLEITEATVGIEYGTSPTNLTGVSSDAFFANYGDSRDFSQSDLATWARIRIQNPRPGRSYQFDVRAIDTSSRYMGPSFCGADGNNFTCTPDSGYGVAIAEIENSTPLSYPEFDNNPFSLNNMISTASRGIQGQVGADGILMPAFGNNRFQCQQGSVSIVQRVTGYAPGLPSDPSLPAGMGIEVCEVSMTSNLNPLPTQPCSCNNNGACFGEGTTLNDTANYTANFLASHECGPAPAPVTGGTYEWCQDLAANFDIAAPVGTVHRLGGPAGFFNGIESVDLRTTVNMPAIKQTCGLVYAVPRSTGAEDYYGVFNSSATVPPLLIGPGWDTLAETGCASLGGFSDTWFTSTGHTQARVTAIDACGRASQNPSRATAFGIFTPQNPTSRLARFGEAVPHWITTESYVEGAPCGEGLYAGCNLPIGGHQCWSDTSCQNRGAICHSNWDNSYSPSEAEMCFDPRVDALGLPLVEQQARAAQRCNTTYQCVDDLNRMGPQAGCPAYLQSCTLTGSCSAPAPSTTPGTCSGGTNNGNTCLNASQCPDGGSCIGVVNNPGACAHNTSLPCYSDSACDISDIHTKCRVATQATCDCPNDRACNQPDGTPYPNNGGGNSTYCMSLFGASGAPTTAASKYCMDNGRWKNWYCGYGTDNGDGTFSITPEDLPFTRTDFYEWTHSGGGTSNCVHLSFENDFCDPIADGGQNFTAEGL